MVTLSKIFYSYLKNNEHRCYEWIQCWLLNLYLKTDYGDHVAKKLLKKIFIDKNKNNLSRATALLAYAKHSSDFDLIFLNELYRETDNTLFKRSILAASSKMPRTYTNEMYKLENSDELDITVLKEYLQNNDYKIEARI